MNFSEFLNNNIVCLDGAIGTLLQERGLLPGAKCEEWNISHPDVITSIHRAYFDAGSNVVNTNTFGANPLKFDDNSLHKIICAAIKNAKAARDTSIGKQEKFIALDVGPLGKLLKPYGDLDFEDAVSHFSKIIKIGEKCGVDLIMIETMNDCYETKAALLAAKESCSLPVLVSNAYSENGALMTGAPPEAMAAMLEGMGADAIGVNCSLGPDMLKPTVERLLKFSSLPIILKPNAGLPKEENGKTVFDISPEAFAESVLAMVKNGVRIIGGCCGTTPEYIKLLSEGIKNLAPIPTEPKNVTAISSYSTCVTFGEKPILIGERINPTGKKRLKQALIDGDIGYILNEGITQEQKGAHVLDVNAGLSEIDEESVLKNLVFELQSVTPLPLQIDTANPVAMEAALRIYNGKALINSVNGKKSSMDAIFPLVKKYGGTVIALTLDEDGIPDTAEGRFEIAEKILSTAKSYGIDKKDIIFDTLTMAISADSKAAKVTLDALKMIKERLGCHTSLGVSNSSFGLPNRDALNSVFFASALNMGLSAAIMNPNSPEMMKTYHAFCALFDMDESCSEYIRFMTENEQKTEATAVPKSGKPLQNAIIHGMKESASSETDALLSDTAPLDIVQNEIIPALDIVGKGYEENRVYLPQLLMSAEAAKAAFESIKNYVLTHKTEMQSRCDIVIATVHGDIHDIGKNIVKLLLENYGFRVTDLGKDVPSEKIAMCVIEKKVPIVGLSALMTTTVPAMEETIRLLRKDAPWCKIMVGGAVLTREYAEKIGADAYIPGAMEAVRYAEEIDLNLKKL